MSSSPLELTLRLLLNVLAPLAPLGDLLSAAETSLLQLLPAQSTTAFRAFPGPPPASSPPVAQSLSHLYRTLLSPVLLLLVVPHAAFRGRRYFLGKKGGLLWLPFEGWAERAPWHRALWPMMVRAWVWLAAFHWMMHGTIVNKSGLPYWEMGVWAALA